MNCPSCGRYVGPYTACPYCGAALDRRTSVRLLKLTAIILALGGLAFLWLMGRYMAVPTLEIGQANAMMNLAYVRVTGRVTRSPIYDPTTGYFSFWLADDSGELRVAAYRNEARELISEARLPALGDWVAVEGTLRVREDALGLTLNVPSKLQIHRSTPIDRAIREISAADQFVRVRVQGQVRAIRAPYPGLTLIALRDGTGEIELAVTEVITALWGDLPDLFAGQSVEVVAPVSLYKETPQLSLVHPADLTLLDTPVAIAAEAHINQVSPTNAGEWLAVSGRVIRVEPFSAGVRYTLDDGGEQITLLLWQSVFDQLSDPHALVVGATVRVQGEVAEYRGELEIVPELPTDVSVLAAAPVATPTAKPLTPTGTATPLPPSPTPIPPTPIGTAAPFPPSPTPLPPTPTRAATFTPPPAPTQAPAHTPTLFVVSVPIGELNSGRTGEEVTVSGQVVNTASFSKGFKFTLDDGSGQITLLMWQDVYDDCWDAPVLNVGATVRATGQVGEFEGELQIEPSFGGDVKVTAPGGPFAPLREIGALSHYLGQRVTIEGQVVRTAGSGGGVAVFVGDATGEVAVFIWNNVLERIARNTGLSAPGTLVRVVGVVQEYRSNLQLVPVLPYDVQVLQ